MPRIPSVHRSADLRSGAIHPQSNAPGRRPALRRSVRSEGDPSQPRKVSPHPAVGFAMVSARRNHRLDEDGAAPVLVSVPELCPSARAASHFPTHPLTHLLSLACLCASSFLVLRSATAAAPRRLHPENPHYLLWRGKPTALITSGEHYGAVLNLDFDYAKYLTALARDRLNLTRKPPRR